ncbi:MAG TPA: hypothetical protein VN417_00660, partial [Candidatus Cryosericum sp.]|nr:hypothetical protein [Candidatus Cryosericum sp.]
MEAKQLMKKPKILLFDCSEDVRNELYQHRFSIEEASFGKNVTVHTSSVEHTFVPLTMETPKNMHEFDVFVIDMCGVDDAIELEEANIVSTSHYRLQIPYPDEICYSSAISSKLILNNAPKKAIYVIFAGDCFDHSYTCTKLGAYNQAEKLRGNTFDFLHKLTTYRVNVVNKSGEIVRINTSTPLRDLLTKHEGSFSYRAVFEHPTEYDSDIKKHVKRNDFISLMLNKDEEVVAFICEDNGTIILVLPQTTKKKEILIDLLEDFFPSILPDFFPESTKFLWVTSQPYALPNQSEYESRKLAAKEEFERTIQGIDREINVNYERYRFLHDLLTGTGELLVAATVSWLKWLGFTNVVDADKEGSTLNEDIDVVEENYIFIIEVKGIGGTSTDAECSQIGKHRRRIEKSNRGKVVYAAYIVNHQRFLPPENRANPPFTQQQIEYAENDE